MKKNYCVKIPIGGEGGILGLIYSMPLGILIKVERLYKWVANAKSLNQLKCNKAGFNICGDRALISTKPRFTYLT